MRHLYTFLALVTFAVTLHTNASAADAPGPIFTNLLVKVRFLRSYHYQMENAGVMEPKNSGFLYKMKIGSSGELWAKRTNQRTLLSQSGRNSLTPPEHPEAQTSFTNLFIFDGKKQYLLNSAAVDPVCLDDPEFRCKSFADAETMLSELLQDPQVRWLGKRKVNSIACQVFETTSRFFALLMSAQDGPVEVAIADETGLPVKVAYRKGQSSNHTDFKMLELNPTVSESRFQPPTDVKYKDAVPDEYGGFKFKN
jgi:outer membrane lipoprotein-sorting protein